MATGIYPGVIKSGDRLACTLTLAIEILKIFRIVKDLVTRVPILRPNLKKIWEGPEPSTRKGRINGVDCLENDVNLNANGP